MKKVTRFCFLLMISIVLVFAGFLTGCHQPMNPNLDFDVPNSAFDTPFASREVLQEIAQVEGNVDWRVARFFALATLEGFRHTQGWEGAVLSQYPIIINYAGTRQPRFYEFRVMRGNVEIGAIVCVAREDEGSPVQFVIPFATLGTTGDVMSVTDIGERRRTTRELSDYARAIDILESLTPEEFETFGIPSQEAFEAMLSHHRANVERNKNFWQQVTESQDMILSLTEQEIVAKFRDDGMVSNAIIVGQWHNRLYRWYNKRNWRIIGEPGTWCGPWVVYFITLGLGAESGFPGIVPTVNNTNQLRAFYNIFERRIGTGPRTFTGLDNGLTHYTRFTINHWAPNNWNHYFNSIDNHLRATQLPVISRRWPIVGAGGFHYRLITGTKAITFWQNSFFPWARYWTEAFYHIQDNGSDGHHRWEPSDSFWLWDVGRVQRR